MDQINEKDFEDAESLPVEEDKSLITIDEGELEKLLADLDQPVESMKKIAAKLQVYLDVKINQELDTVGYISESTRKIMHEYNDLLDKIQKALHGEKKTLDGNLTHGQIGSMIREYVNIGPDTIVEIVGEEIEK